LLQYQNLSVTTVEPDFIFFSPLQKSRAGADGFSDKQTRANFLTTEIAAQKVSVMINADGGADSALAHAGCNRRKLMKNRNFLYKIIFITIYLAAATVFVSAQDEEPPSRSISSMDFQSQRPKSVVNKSAKDKVQPKPAVSNQKRSKNIDVISRPGRRYNLLKRVPAAQTKNSQTGGATSKNRRPNSQNKVPAFKNEKIGVTFWRLRELESYERDDAPTFPVETKKGTEFWTAERVSSNTKFKSNDRVRFSIESPRTGFLYIVNREVYRDGSRGEAKLIFPTLKTNGKGDNRVVAGRLIEVPHSSARSPFWRLGSKQPDYAGEEIIVIISPTKLAGIKLDVEPTSIAAAKVGKWLDDWSATVDIFEAEDGEGVAVTKAEEEAAQTRALTEEEPSPQTIYSIKARVNQPLLIVFQLQTRK
jgi:hypothetical protein